MMQNPPTDLPPAYQQPPPCQEAVTTIVIQQATPGRDYSHYKGRAAVVLGITQVVVGVLTVISVSLANVFDAQTNTYEHIPLVLIIGSMIGYPGAIFFIISGSIAIASGKKKSSCLIIATMVLSIIAMSTFDIAYLIFYCVTLTFAPSQQICDDGYDREGCVQNTGLVGFCVICVILAVVFFGAALGSAILTCKAVCCRPRTLHDGAVHNQPLVSYQPPSGAYGVPVAGSEPLPEKAGLYS